MAENEPKRTPLGAFVHHQSKAIEESGKAVASLLPKEFRTHLGNAADEGRAGFEALLDGVVQTVQDGLDKLRRKPENNGNEKVKIEVE